jgi:putative transposase
MNMRPKTGISISINPTPDQIVILDRWCVAQGLVWNGKIAENRYDYWLWSRSDKTERIELNSCYAHLIHDHESDELLDWARDIPSPIYSPIVRQWNTTMAGLFKKNNAAPRFKGRDQMDSVAILANVFTWSEQEISENYYEYQVDIKRIGIIAFKSKKLQPARNIRLKNKNGKWFISFSNELDFEVMSEDEKIQYYSNHDSLEELTVGIDRGVAVPACTDSEYMVFDDHYRSTVDKYQRMIAKAQQSLSKAKRGSNHYKKLRHRISKLHRKIAGFRAHQNHIISKKLVESKYEVLVFEDLDVKKMTSAENKKISKKVRKGILDVSWGQLKQFTEYKAERKNKLVVIINPAYTSQTCSHCGYVSKKNRVSQSSFKCKQCGFERNADQNASLNIKAAGIWKLRAGYSGKKKLQLAIRRPEKSSSVCGLELGSGMKPKESSCL